MRVCAGSMAGLLCGLVSGARGNEGVSLASPGVCGLGCARVCRAVARHHGRVLTVGLGRAGEGGGGEGVLGLAGWCAGGHGWCLVQWTGCPARRVGRAVGPQ